MEVCFEDLGRQFRHLSNDFIEARRITLKDLYPIKHRLLKEANGIVSKAWELGGLRSLTSLSDRIEQFEANVGSLDLEHATVEQLESFTERQKFQASPHAVWRDTSSGWLFSCCLFELLVGFSEVVADCETIEVLVGFQGKSWKENRKECRYFLRSGLLATEGRMLKRELYLGTDLPEYDIRNEAHLRSFEVLGYYSQGCQVLAEELDTPNVGRGEVERPLPPMLRGKNPQRLVRCFWREADWTSNPASCDARKICREIWPEECLVDIETIVSTRLKKTLSDTNNGYLSLEIPISFSRNGDLVELHDFRN